MAARLALERMLPEQARLPTAAETLACPHPGPPPARAWVSLTNVGE
jgi:hypothetical protein